MTCTSCELGCVAGWACVDLNHGPLRYQGCFSDLRHLLQPWSAGLPVCPRVTVTIRDRRPIGHVAGTPSCHRCTGRDQAPLSSGSSRSTS
jgi:hypothetical protein